MKALIVAFEYPPFPGGQATYAYEMARALHSLGHEVCAVVPRYEALPIEEAFPVFSAFEHQRLTTRACAWMAHFLLTGECWDVVLCCDIRASLLFAVMPPARGRRVIAMYHGGEVLHGQHDARYRLICQLSAWRKDTLVANSAYSAELALTVIGKPTRAIPLGVSDYWFGNANGLPDHPALRDVIENSGLVFCLAARLERRKGHLEAFQAILRTKLHKMPGCRFVFAGKVVDDTYHAEVMSYVQSYPDTFIYLGTLTRDDVRRLYAASDALLLLAQPQPRHIEGFGLVITEAAAQGCPVLTTRVGGIPDALDEGSSGLICDAADTAAIDRALLALANDATLREHLATGARARARRDSWNDVARLTLADDS